MHRRRSWVALVTALLALAVPGRTIAQTCIPDAYEPDQTLETAKPIALGETQRRSLCDGDLVRLDLPAVPATYAVETSNLRGGTDTVLEVVVQERDVLDDGSTVEHVYVVARDSGGGGEPGASYVLAPVFGPSGFARFRTYVRVTSADGAPVPSYDVTLRCEDRCGATGTRLFLPAVVHATGIRGELFRTDVRLFNPNPFDVAADLVFTPSGDAPPARLTRTVTISSGTLRAFGDLLGELFGVQGAGSLEVRPMGGDVQAGSRTRDVARSGGLGDFLPPAQFGLSFPYLTTRIAPFPSSYAVSGSGGLRSNLALAGRSGGHASVRLTLRGEDGTPLGTRAERLAPFGHLQINDVFSFFGVAPREHATVVVSEGSLPVTAYASVLDAESGRFALEAPTFTGSEVVPVLPASDGEKTDLFLANVDAGVAVTLSLSFLPGGGAPARPAKEVVVPAGQTVVLADVVNALGAAGRGAVLVESRTKTPDGFFAGVHVSARAGRFVPAVRWPGLQPGQLGVSLFADAGDALRLRALVVVPYGSSARVRMRLVSEDGRPLGEKTIDVPGRGSAALDDVFAALGAAPAANARLEFQVLDGVANCFASPLDTRSGDAFLVPAELEGSQRVIVNLAPGAFIVAQKILAGPFRMGSPAEERGRDGDEALHPVSLTRDFYLSDREIRADVWTAVMGAPPPGTYGTGVSWNQIAGPGGFLEKLNASLASRGQGGIGPARLPTEAEWEFAARAGTTTRFWFGDALDCDDGCAPCSAIASKLSWCGNGLGFPTDTSSDKLNAFGLLDMLGNVWEWVADRYAPFDGSPATDPTGPSAGSTRVIRGGGYQSELRLCRSANRYAAAPDQAFPYVGFRVAFGPPPPER